MRKDVSTGMKVGGLHVVILCISAMGVTFCVAPNAQWAQGKKKKQYMYLHLARNEL